jgi:hypothetical protein
MATKKNKQENNNNVTGTSRQRTTTPHQPSTNPTTIDTSSHRSLDLLFSFLITKELFRIWSASILLIYFDYICMDCVLNDKVHTNK